MKFKLKRVLGLACVFGGLGCGMDPGAGAPARVASRSDGLASVPSGFTASNWASGLSSATAMNFAPDGRLFVAEQGGRLRVVKNGSLLSTPFVALSVDSTVERGLLGVAVDPAFATNNFVYVYYTTTAGGAHNRVSRFTANGDVAAPGSEVVLLELNPLGAAHHNGGALHFGSDGALYVAVGDNGVSSNAQSLQTLHGKILRMNRDGSVPGDNPFLSSTTGNNRLIWAMGLRNPFTFAFDLTTSRMFINDVGESTTEEVNDGRAGGNYGWPATEGPTTNPSFRGPIHWYSRTEGCAITGGAFYTPPSRPFPASFSGDYFYADFCSGFIRAYDLASNSVSTFATGVNGPVDLKVGNDGALYYLERGSGVVGRIEHSVSSAPAITQQPSSMTVSAGQTASFACSASGSAPLGYQWQRNGVTLAGATTRTLSFTATASDNGARFRCVASNSIGTATSAEATLTVLSSSAPRATITTPAAGTLYSGGELISYAGTGTDPEDGTLPASAFRWRVDFHHDTHFHPFAPETSGTQSGSFRAPTEGELSANVWFRIHLTVTDSTGLTNSTFLDVRPRTVSVTLATDPAGLQLTLDGQPVTSPHSFTGVVGLQRTLGATSPQTLNGVTYEFVSWSDQGAATHTISTPAAATTYRATFRATTTPTQGTGLQGSYFNNMDLTAPAVQRLDPLVNFDWGNGAPDPAVAPDTFSVRWTGQVQPSFSETYTFFTTSDDGVRLWVNNVLLVDNWTNHAPIENSGRITLTANQKYDIRMEYFENSGGAVARLFWSSPSTPKAVVPTRALFPGPSTPPTTATLTLASSPAGLQLTLDGQTVTSPHTFSSVVGSSRTIGVVSPQTVNGVTYQFESWSDSGAATHTITTPSTATTYTATFQVVTTPTGTGLNAQYFHNVDLTSPALTRVDPTVDLNWGTGSPDPSIAPDTFSVRWTGQIQPSFSELYTFFTTSDDGVRVWINGALVINNWTNHAPLENSGQVRLVANQKYDIRVEYYENTGGAQLRLSWSSPSTVKQVVPRSALLPSTTPPPPPPPPGSGLTADYYNNLDLTAFVLRRVDATVNFDWGSGSPDPAIGPDTFSVRWTGQIQPAFSETYNFYTFSDDGIRLWVNGVLVINNWTDHAPIENVGSITLVAGQRYQIQVEYYDNVVGATARLSWSSPSTPKQIVPASALFP